uniref:Uncharacterized protein n=1 Tax=Sus scrofa TaxID=9823 RepID=A0A4X1VK78_PIG
IQLGTMRLRYLVESKLKTQKNQPSLKSLKTNNKPEKSKYKPLWGKVFYIDLPSVTLSEKLQKDIKDLGGRVEEFLNLKNTYLSEETKITFLKFL